MTCRIADLRSKEVISVQDGGRLGYVSDVEIDTASAAVTALVIYGRGRLMGLMGREQDTVIPWKDIEMIGGDIVLVKCQSPKRQPGLMARLWEKLLG